VQPVCGLTTAKGTPCTRKCVAGLDRCSSHLGTAHRRTTLTPDVIENVTAMLRAGCHDRVALKAANVPPSTFADWMRRGQSSRPGDELFRELRQRVEQARAQGEARLVALLARQAEQDWHVAAWMLERRYPERWARTAVRPEKPAQPAPAPVEADPFAELDELAAHRARRGA